MSTPSHEELRESLGAYALGHLDPLEQRLVQEHLAGCSACRAELDAIAPVAQRLQLLTGYDSAVVAPTSAQPGVPVPAVTGDATPEEPPAPRRTRAVAAVGTAVVVALVLGGVAGGVAGRASAPASAVAAPVESVSLAAPTTTAATAATGAPEISSAGLVAHSWGVELLMSGQGFDRGSVFRVRFRDARGGWAPAGQFMGVGEDPLDCRMQSGLPRERAVGVQVLGPDGRPVLRADL